MALRTILEYPDPRLRTRAQRVTQFDAELGTLIDDMFETMYAAPGIGLAATQVDFHKRLIVMDVSENHDQPLVFINPEILSREGEEVSEEGCLSVPEFWEEVERPAKIKAEYLDRDGKAQTLEAEGLLATCLQHEMDHLEGVLFIDHLSKLKRSIVLRKLQKAKRLKDAG